MKELSMNSHHPRVGCRWVARHDSVTPASAGATMGMVFAFAVTVAVAGCGGNSSAGGTGGSGAGGGNAGGTLAYKPCDGPTRVGGFSLQLSPATTTKPAASIFGGGVKNGFTPLEGRTKLAQEGSCVLTGAPVLSCATPCMSPQVCAGGNKCIDAPVYQDLGTVTVTGLARSVTAPPKQYYADLTDLAYPPFAAGDLITLSTAGGVYPAFTLEGRGIDPLIFPGTGLHVARNMPLAVTWTAPAKAGSTQIFMRLDISHHGGGSARVECDVPDTGSATIPATLINQLIDMGTAGFPTLSLVRRTMDSETITPGCVDLAIASPIEREIEVEGITSCNCDSSGDCPATDAKKCPDGQVCRPAGVPGGLTCGPAA